MRRRLALTGLAFSLVLLAGCEKSPSGDYDAARYAVEEAVRASSGRWAPMEIDHAKALLATAGRELEEQNARFPLARSYARARTLLAAARADAIGAREAAERERDEAKAEAAEAVRRARNMLEGARAAVQIAPSPRDGRGEIDLLRETLHGVEMELPEADRLMASGEYRLAAKKGSDLAARVESAVSRFFGRIERGGARGSRGEREAACAACPAAAERLSFTPPREGKEDRS
jgi:hypothetical protein